MILDISQAVGHCALTGNLNKDIKTFFKVLHTARVILLNENDERR